MKVLGGILTAIIVAFVCWALFVTYVPYSNGTRAGELVKFSQRGVIFDTWEGEVVKGLGGQNIFAFSVLDDDQEVIDQLNDYIGKFVKVTYEERYTTFYWWGDTKYFIKSVELDDSPLFKMPAQ